MGKQNLGSSDDTPIPTIVELVTSKGDDFIREWESLFMDENKDEVWSPVLDILDTEAEHEWIQTAVRHTIEFASNYTRRFLRTFRKWPLFMFWLVYSACDVVCDDRKKCAADMLEESEDVLGPALVIIRQAMWNYLKAAKSTGKLDPEVLYKYNQTLQ